MDARNRKEEKRDNAQRRDVKGPWKFATEERGKRDQESSLGA